MYCFDLTFFKYLPLQLLDFLSNWKYRQHTGGLKKIKDSMLNHIYIMLLEIPTTYWRSSKINDNILYYIYCIHFVCCVHMGYMSSQYYILLLKYKHRIILIKKWIKMSYVPHDSAEMVKVIKMSTINMKVSLLNTLVRRYMYMSMLPIFKSFIRWQVFFYIWYCM